MEYKIIGYLIGLTPIVSYCVKVFIDNWGATDLEKIMMNNFKKFQIGFTKYSLMGMVLGTIFVIYILINVQDEWDGKVTWYWLGFFILSTLFFIILDKAIMFIFNILSFKYDYFVVDEKGDPVYRVIKRSDKNCLLVEENGIEEFLVNPKKKRYKRIRKKCKILSVLYSGKTAKRILIGTSIMTVFFFICIFLTERGMTFIAYLLFVFSLYLLLICLTNILDERRYRKNKQETNTRIRG